MCGEDYQLGDSLSDLGCIISGWSVISRSHLGAGTLKQVLAKSARLGEEDVVSKPCSAGGGASTMDLCYQLSTLRHWYLKCWERISYQSVAFPLTDFLVWKPTLNRKEEANCTVVRLISSPSSRTSFGGIKSNSWVSPLDSFSPWATVT